MQQRETIRDLTVDPTRRQYVGQYEYINDTLYQINTSQGYILLNNESLDTLSREGDDGFGVDISYTGEKCLVCTPQLLPPSEEPLDPIPVGALTVYYNIKDHLGNTRVSYKDSLGFAVLSTEHHYYPFGMEMEGSWSSINNPSYDYLYNGKELQRDFDLGYYSYGARFYDPSIGRFTGVDPISDQFPHLSTYNYASNDPVSNIDLHGLQGVKMTRGMFNVPQRRDPLMPNPQNEFGLLGDGRMPQSSSVKDVGMTQGDVIDVNGANNSEFNGDGFMVADIVSDVGVLSFNEAAAVDELVGVSAKGSQALSKGFGILSFGVGVSTAGSIELAVDNGELTRSQANGLLVNNAVGTALPPQLAIPFAAGQKVGEENASAIDNFSVWVTENIVFPLLGVE